MEIEKQLGIILQIIIAIVIGGFIGFEREQDKKEAGVRTYAAVCMGSCLFTLIAVNMMDADSASRIVSNIVVGIGFLGAGVIFKDPGSNRTSGLTSAATIWATAAVGIAIGYKLYIIAVISAIAIYFLLSLHHVKWFEKWIKRSQEDHKDEE